MTTRPPLPAAIPRLYPFRIQPVVDTLTLPTPAMREDAMCARRVGDEQIVATILP